MEGYIAKPTKYDTTKITKKIHSVDYSCCVRHKAKSKGSKHQILLLIGGGGKGEEVEMERVVIGRCVRKRHIEMIHDDLQEISTCQVGWYVVHNGKRGGIRIEPRRRNDKTSERCESLGISVGLFL